MGSIVLSDVGGHHFHNTMFGGGSAHQQPQESPAVHHTPVRPSPQVSTNPPLRIAAPADVPMADSDPARSSSTTPGHRSQQQNSSGLSPYASRAQQQAQHPPPSPRFRPHSQQPTPVGATPNATAFSNPRTVPASTPPSAHQSPITSLRSPLDSAAASPRRIKVKSLSHIQSFATDESSPFSQTRSLSRRQRRDPNDVGPQYEISEMPVSDIIEMVAGLLTKITTTNDRQHEHLHRQIPPPEGTTGLNQQTTSVLAFHGKNVPSISILSYLSRIHKYCPTTYEVFLSLLVYFDRMTERVNSGPMQSLRQANQQSLERATANNDGSRQSFIVSAPLASQPSPLATSNSVQAATPPPSGSLGKPAETPVREDQPPSPPQHIEPPLESDPYNLSHFFVVDSFNIHRLVIAGVTCASKFFSDVFYTNSRYAKVGGLPLVELNHLELQFLLLNDFRLAVPLEEMEAYGTMLVEFYVREVAAQQHAQQAAARTHAHSGHPA
ncbi:cyclin-domain-containing protein [Zopfia rhizophila CBS 207.26]|uniref:Cyclin-domain-containing protein n=1 Tax=Zopfia rhizophila CBS 207.26 TaxID=1314779 RepID=A0A6A6DKX5_9PEZI|nr:cyclin-domain-containing protein [Zopfia rhizophila CBS 207.26]